jgi:hypothetical protein
MRKPTLIQGILTAFVLSVVSMLLLMGLSIVPLRAAYPVLIAILAACYIAYLLSRRDSGVGRITLGVVTWGALFGSCFLGLSIGVVTLLAVGLIWLVRSFLRYASLVSAMLDGLLCTVSLACASGAAMLTGSAVLTVWCFFLIQALWVFIPPTFEFSRRWRTFEPAGDQRHESTDRFSRAYHAAEEAIRCLAQ